VVKMGRTSEYINKQYGFPVETVEAQVVLVGAAAAAPVLLPNPNRVSYTIFNLGANVAFVGFTDAVGVLFGIQLNAAGDFFGTDAKDDGELPARMLFGISALGTTLYIVENVAVR
jgi:hypothetical protein